MNRYATFLAVVTLAGGLAALRTADEQPSPHEPVGLQDTLSEDERVKNLLTQYRVFKGTFDAAIDSLRHGHIHLKEALTMVRDASNRYHPKYLKLLALSDRGATSDERLARNILGHARTREKYQPTQPSPFPGLDEELCEFLAETGE